MSSKSMYEPLIDPDTIRVLEIGFAGPGSDQLSGHLAIERLHLRPKYNALSYVWGEWSSDDPSILVNNCPFQIRKSLFQAISLLVSRSTEAKIRLWVDQICTNQSDNTEKEQQVQLMSEIYSQAYVVEGWLGDDADNSYAAMASFYYIHGIAAGFKTEDQIPQAFYGINDIASLVMEMKNPRTLIGQACTTLLRRPWFQRLWIVQEMVLAKNLRLWCGTNFIPGDIFLEIVNILYQLLRDNSASNYEELAYRRVLELGMLRVRAQRSNKPWRSIPHLLQKICSWECQKPQDRLNAIFGFAFAHYPAEPWFKPSYSLSAPDLFTQFAVEHIRATKSLDILHFAGCGNIETSLEGMEKVTLLSRVAAPADDVASWVPDWRLRQRPLPLQPLVLSDQEGCKLGVSATCSDAEFSLDLVSHTLSVRAIEVDRVKARGMVYHPLLTEASDQIDDLMLTWLELAKHHIGTTGVNTLFPLTLTMDMKMNTVAHPRYFKFATILADFERHNRERLYKGEIGKDLLYWINTYKEVIEFRLEVEEPCRYRALFVTEQGRLGLGGAQVKEGDLIYLIHGLRVPFVVNFSSEKQLLRGECYVHGLMDGEVQRSDQDTMLHLS